MLLFPLAAALLSILVIPIQVPENASAYTPHAPILIDGDGDFTFANGVNGGSGTSANPYVIEGWEIDASTANGIEVRNTNAHFVIRGVYVHSGSAGFYHGVFLDNADNGIVTNATVVDNLDGFNLQSSANVTIAASNVSSNDRYGLRASVSSNLSVTANNLSYNGDNGIYISISAGVHVDGNKVTNNGDGVGFYACPANVSITNNSVASNGWYGISINQTSAFAAGNVVYGNGWYGFYVTYAAGVSLVSNSVFDNGGEGIGILWSSTDISLQGNAIFNNGGDGLRLWNLGTPADVSVMGNDILNNSGYGVYLGFSKNVSVTDNRFSSDGVLIEGGTLADYNTHTITPDNLVNGRPLYYHKDCADLVVDGVPVGQLLVANCTNVTASDLQISDTDVGVELAFVNGATVGANNISSGYDGVVLHFSSDTSVTDNTFASNDGTAVYLGRSTNLTVAFNEVSHSYREGIFLYGSSNASVVGNVVSNTTLVGIRVLSSTGCSIYHNDLIDNWIQATNDVLTPNTWDDGYPSGGNYWSDYTGPDVFSGPNQDQPGSDGIGDWPRPVAIDIYDYYPLMSPYTGADDDPPIIFIASPGEGQTVYATPITVTGTASDVGAGASGLDRVEVRVNGGVWQNASGTSSWGLPVDLVLGTNRIEARAWDKAGNPSSVAAVVNVTYALDTPPTAAFTVSPSSGSVATMFSVDASSSSDAQDPTASLEVRWDWEDDGTWDTTFTTTKTAQHGYASLGTHTIRAEVRDTSDLRDEATRQVWVNNTLPTASFTVAPTAGDVATSFLVDAYASSDLEDAGNALEVRWDWEDDGTWDTSWSATKAAQHAYAAPGTYAIRLEVRDTGGLTDATTRQVTVNNTPPMASFTVAPDEGNVMTNFLVNASASSDLEGPAALEIRWDWEDDGTWDTTFSTERAEQHRYPSPGTYTIRLEVRDAGGLTDQATRQVWVNNTPPSASFTVAPTSGDTSTTFAFNASASADLEDSSDAIQIRWDWEDDGTWDTDWTTTRVAEHRYSEAGVYSVRLEVRDTGALTDSFSSSITVVARNPPPTLPVWLLAIPVVITLVLFLLLDLARRRKVRAHTSESPEERPEGRRPSPPNPPPS